jgi:hypothetical protein
MKILFVILCLLSTSSWASIGTVTDAKGTGCEIVRNKNKLSGNKGSTVESMDTVLNASCESKITFKDDTKVNVTANSRLLIDDFVYDPKKSDAGKLVMKVTMGSVRYASGQIAKNNSQNVDIKTPTATIAVRGTDFNMVVDETGQSLVILLPSCKDPKDVKQYELEENRCKVGKIEVSTMAGTVTLDQAFEGTYVTSASIMPSPPTVINTIESKIGNNLIISRPQEVQRAIREAGKSKQELEQEEMEAEAARRLAQMVRESQQQEQPKKFAETFASGAGGCNSTTNICVIWDKADSPDMQSRGKGVAYRVAPNEHYAEVKTLGYSSNTFLTVTQNYTTATELLGDGSPGGNVVSITQNLGVRKNR